MPNLTTSNRTIALLGDYLPRKCGIATFTSDLLGALAAQHPRDSFFAVAVTDIDGSYQYPDVVRMEIAEQELESYRLAADFLCASAVDAISVQHEFGIFGGSAGSHLLALLRRVNSPIVTTLHTVLRHPNADQRRVMHELLKLSTRLVVMTEHGKAILQEVYRAPADKIDLIPHGIPDFPFVSSEAHKEKLGLSGKQVLLTFGLLSPNKGIENVLHALPEIVMSFPDVIYVVLGATHPNVLRCEGDEYRLSLEAIVEQNHLQDHVVFHNRFVELDELTEHIGASDIYITPYLDESQITSGTLAYAFGAGKAVISTPYAHAAELLGEERGVLVPFADPKAIALAVTGLLRDEPRRKAMSDNAYRLGRDMVWSNTARLYMRSFDSACSQPTPARRPPGLALQVEKSSPGSVEINLKHLQHMTDSTGLFQHATLTSPNLAEGYCTDDNARALILTALLTQLSVHQGSATPLATTYAAFLHRAFNEPLGRFRNFLSTDRHWLDEHGSEDSHGRAIWALGMAVGRAPHWSSTEDSQRILIAALPVVNDFSSPRAWAFTLLGIHEFLQSVRQVPAAEELRAELVARLMALFDKVSEPGWTWFEDGLTYDNAKLAHALITSGRAMGNEDVYERGMRALRWLISVQTSQHGELRPIGSNGFYKRNGTRARFDQQPIEAHATISACLEAYRATSDLWWYEQAQRDYGWFLGRNDLGLELYSEETGGCRDGLHPDRSNENQGAESTLAFLLSLAEIQLVQTTAKLSTPIGQVAAANA